MSLSSVLRAGRVLSLASLLASCGSTFTESGPQDLLDPKFVSTLQYAGYIAPWLVDWSVAGSYQVNRGTTSATVSAT